MSQITPKRMVLKYREEYFKDLKEMITAFSDSQSLGTLEDCYVHHCYDPSSPSSLFLVLDLYCKEVPDVDVSKLELRMFKVSKPIVKFRDLGAAASKQAQPRSLTLRWGTDQSNQKS
ncbi:hypothetical protein F5884DRAFT_534903 [Xylogone sp. PMI_703]|nr:hypothetical protein F5884DRAFT_534903 [Xylogone sp. PMI_703]